MNRRYFLKKTFAYSAWSLVSSLPMGWLRAETSQKIASKTVTGKQEGIVMQHPMHQEIVSALGEYESIIQAQKVDLLLPDMVEYQDSVAIQVKALKRKDINAIAIIIDNNAEPLVIVSELSSVSDAYLSVRVQIEQDSLVRTIVRTDKGLEEINALLRLKADF